MSIINNMPNRGGMDINGIIQEYYVYKDTTLEPGDFVEYINGVAANGQWDGVDYHKQIYSGAMSDTLSCGRTVVAALVNKNKALVLHKSNGGSQHYVVGVVVEFSESGITCGSSHTLITSQYYGRSIALEKTSENTLLAFCGSGNGYMYGQLLTIEGTTITKVGSFTTIDSTSDAGQYIKTGVLEENKIFVLSQAHESSLYASGVVCTVSGTSITKGSNTVLSSEYPAGRQTSLAILNSTKIFATTREDNGSGHIWGLTANIDGTTITRNSFVELDATYESSSNASAARITDDLVFLAHRSSDTTIARLIKIEDDVPGSIYNVTIVTSAKTTQSIILESGKIFVLLGSVSGMIVTIADDLSSFIFGTETSLVGSSVGMGQIKGVCCLGDCVFLPSVQSSYVCCDIFGSDLVNNIPVVDVSFTDYEQQVRVTTSLKSDGLAKTGGQGGDNLGHKDKIEIYVPNITE